MREGKLVSDYTGLPRQATTIPPRVYTALRACLMSTHQEIYARGAAAARQALAEAQAKSDQSKRELEQRTADQRALEKQRTLEALEALKVSKAESDTVCAIIEQLTLDELKTLSAVQLEPAYLETAELERWQR